MSGKVFNLLFLCTGNSARSIMAEALANHLGQGRFKAWSAGSHPGGAVNPFAIETLHRMGLSTTDLRSKSWDEFAKPGAPQLDFVFTVCDNAAGEVCPFWPGKPVTAHWGVDDPAVFDGPDDRKREIFHKAALVLKRRIELFAALPIAKLDAIAMQNQLKQIGAS